MDQDKTRVFVGNHLCTNEQYSEMEGCLEINMRRLSKSCSSWLFVHLILKKPYATCVKLGSSCSFATFSGGLWEPKKHTSFNQEIDPFGKIQESNVYVQEATLSSISWISWISASEEKKTQKHQHDVVKHTFNISTTEMPHSLSFGRKGVRSPKREINTPTS